MEERVWATQNYLSQCSTLRTYVRTRYRYQSKTAKELLDTILSIQPKDSSGGGGETREAVVSRQAADMLEKLPPAYAPHEVKTLNGSSRYSVLTVCS